MPTRRANLKDVAEAASVSTATVDRVLNDRGRVKDATIERVRRAAEELGFPTGLNREDFLYRVLLQDPDHLYYRELGEAISREAEAYSRRGLNVEIEFLVETEDSLVAEKFDELSRDADGIAGVFVQNTLTLEAVSRAIERGKPVVTLLSDLRHPLRAAYVGLDNRTVGRTGRICAGKVCEAAFRAGTGYFRNHELPRTRRARNGSAVCTGREVPPSGDVERHRKGTGPGRDGSANCRPGQGP